MRAGEVEELRCENERLRMALRLQGASGWTMDERLRNALKACSAEEVVVPAVAAVADAPAVELAADVCVEVEAEALTEAPARAASEAVGGQQFTTPKQARRATDEKPCSRACEEAGLLIRQDWQALEATVDACIDRCSCLGPVTAARLQAALCKAHVHTHKKAVQSLLGRYRKAHLCGAEPA